MSLYSSLTQVLAPFAAKINGLLTGWDGTRYTTPGEAVRRQITDLHVLIGDEPGTAIQASAVAYDDSNVGAELTGINGRLGELKADLNDVNAELADVRVGADGVTYGSAGAAVRGQISYLNTSLNDATSLNKKSLLTNVTWSLGTFGSNDGRESPSTTRIRCDQYIDISDLTQIEFTIESGYKYTVYCFDASKNYLQSASLYNWQTQNRTKTFNSNVKYIRFLVADTNDGQASVSYANQFTAKTITQLVRTVIDNKENSSPNINDYSGISLGWEIGTLNTSSGNELAANNRIRSKKVLVGRGTQIKLKNSSYRHLIHTYDLMGTYQTNLPWKDDSYVFTVNEDCYIRILMKYSNDAVINSEAMEIMSADEIVQRNIPNTVFDTYAYEDPSKIYSIRDNIHKKAEITTFKQKKTSSEAWNECDLKMMFFTDVHGDATRTKRMTDLVKAWGTDYFNVAVCGGDIVTDTITQDLAWYYSAVNDLPVPLLNTVGNHDAWMNLNELADKTDVYAKIIAPIVSGSSIVQPSGAETNGYNYYYKDFNNAVRIIVIDCMYWDATQLTWFTNVLNDAKTNNLHVVCISHAAFPVANMEKVDCLWSKSGINTDGTRTNIQAASAVKDFIDAGGKFVAWIVGHQHGDSVHKLTGYGNQFVINLASFAQRAGWLLKNTDPTAYNYDCLTFVAVDASNSIVKFNRIGADIDIYGTQYHGLVIDYANNQLISSY